MKIPEFLSLLLILASPGVASALEDSQIGDPLADLIRGSGIDELASTDTDWAVRTLVRDGFARSSTPQQQVAASLRRPRIVDLRHRLARDLAEDTLVHRATPGFDLTLGGVAYDIPMAEHPLVDRYIKLFTGRGRWYFERWLARADRYLPIMQPILEAKGIPSDTVYLAMIESGFASHAYSRAAASGFWQFIPSTGRQYKLRQDTWVDERRDFIKATKSAANYLSALKRQFDDWHLAWAGYNAGGGRVSRALARYGADDFWSLIENHRSLAKETRHYVPKIIAAAIVAKNREHYGFTSVEPLSPLEYDEVEVEDAVALRRVAKHLEVTLEELNTLNPALLYQVTPPGRRYTLRVPKGSGAEVSTWLASVPRSERTGFRQYTVRGGDTLWVIAKRYSANITAVKELNGIRNARHLKVGQRLVLPTVAGRGPRPTGGPKHRVKATAKRKTTRPVVASIKTTTKVKSKSKTSPSARHTVSRGDTLWSISQRYRVSVADLRQWNGRRGSIIAVGEILKIF